MQGCEQEEPRFKRQRHDATVQIRKEKRQERFQAARRSVEPTEEQAAPSIQPQAQVYRTKKITIVDPMLSGEIREILHESFRDDNFPDIVRVLHDCSDPLAVHWATIGLRVILVSSRGYWKFYQRVIDDQLVPVIVRLTTLEQYPQLKYEAAWILTNLASGSSGQVRTVVQNGGIQAFVRLVKQKQEKIVEQAIWGVANLTADDNQYRDLFIDANVIDDIVEASECYDSKILRNICGMALSNLARGKPLPPTVNVLSGLLFLCKGLRNGYFTDEDTIKDALFALYYHFTPKKKNISLLIDSFVIPAIIEMGIKAVNVYDESYIVVITKLMGNIILGNQAQVKYLISEGVFTYLEKLILSRKEILRKEVCWILSNIVASSASVAKKLLEEKDLIEKILQLLRNEHSQAVLIDAHYIFFNFSSVVDANTFLNIAHKYELIGKVADNLVKEDSPTVIFLESILLLLDVYYEMIINQKKRGKVLLVGFDAKQRLQNLEGHGDENIAKMAIRIVRNMEYVEND